MKKWKTIFLILFAICSNCICEACDKCIQEILESQKEIKFNLDTVFLSKENITRDPMQFYIFGERAVINDEKDYLYNLDLSFLYYQGKLAENKKLFSILQKNHPNQLE